MTVFFHFNHLLPPQSIRDAQYRNYFNLEEEVTQAQPAINAEALKVQPVSRGRGACLGIQSIRAYQCLEGARLIRAQPIINAEALKSAAGE